MIRIMQRSQYPIVGLFLLWCINICLNLCKTTMLELAGNMKVLLYLSDPHKNNKVSALFKSKETL